MDSIDLKSVNIKVETGNKSSIQLNDVDITMEFDINSIHDDFFEAELENRGFYVSDEEPDIGDYSDSELKSELQARGFCVLDEEPEDTYLSDFSDEEILQELDYRELTVSGQDLAWYLQAGQFQDFLIHLERYNPEFSGLSNMKLTK